MSTVTTMTGLQDMSARRGPRYLVHGTVRRGEYLASYADTATAASALADRWRDGHIRQVRITEPAEQTTLADLSEHGVVHAAARAAADETRAVLRAAVSRAVEGGLSEAEAARAAGVDRMTVRSWLGKR